jgi:hypothetical protein
MKQTKTRHYVGILFFNLKCKKMKTKSFNSPALQPIADFISKFIGGGQIKFCQLKFLLIALAFISDIYPGMPKLAAQTDTMICDNGGFESNFQYYFGEECSYDMGSSTCSPSYYSNPVNWISKSLPSFRRFEIVTTGVDTLTGINRTKFGSKALLINN